MRSWSTARVHLTSNTCSPANTTLMVGLSSQYAAPPELLLPRPSKASNTTMARLTGNILLRPTTKRRSTAKGTMSDSRSTIHPWKMAASALPSDSTDRSWLFLRLLRSFQDAFHQHRGFFFSGFHFLSVSAMVRGRWMLVQHVSIVTHLLASVHEAHITHIKLFSGTKISTTVETTLRWRNQVLKPVRYCDTKTKDKERIDHYKHAPRGNSVVFCPSAPFFVVTTSIFPSLQHHYSTFQHLSAPFSTFQHPFPLPPTTAPPRHHLPATTRFGIEHSTFAS